MSDEPEETGPKIGVILAVIITALVTTVAVGFTVFGFKDWLSWSFWQTVTTDNCGKIISKQTDRSAVVRNLSLLILPVIALLLAYWRSTVASQQAITATNQLDLAERGHATDRFQKGIEMLDNENPFVRIAGIRFLHDIAKDEPKKFARNALEILSAFAVARSQEHQQEAKAVPSRGGHIDMPTDLTAALKSLPIIRDQCGFGNKEESNTSFDLRHLNLSNYKLHAIDLAGANLFFAELRGLHLNHTDFSRTVLSSTNFDTSQFHLTSFEDAIFLSPSFKGSTFFSVNVSNTEIWPEDGLTQKMFDNAWAWKDRQPVWKMSIGDRLKVGYLIDPIYRPAYKAHQKHGIPVIENLAKYID